MLQKRLEDTMNAFDAWNLTQNETILLQTAIDNITNKLFSYNFSEYQPFKETTTVVKGKPVVTKTPIAYNVTETFPQFIAPASY